MLYLFITGDTRLRPAQGIKKTTTCTMLYITQTARVSASQGQYIVPLIPLFFSMLVSSFSEELHKRQREYASHGQAQERALYRYR